MSQFHYNYYQATITLGPLSFIVYHRASTTTRALLPVGHYLQADKPETIIGNSAGAQIEEVEPRDSSSARGNQYFRALVGGGHFSRVCLKHRMGK